MLPYQPWSLILAQSNYCLLEWMAQWKEVWLKLQYLRLNNYQFWRLPEIIIFRRGLKTGETLKNVYVAQRRPRWKIKLSLLNILWFYQEVKGVLTDPHMQHVESLFSYFILHIIFIFRLCAEILNNTVKYCDIVKF